MNTQINGDLIKLGNKLIKQYMKKVLVNQFVLEFDEYEEVIKLIKFEDNAEKGTERVIATIDYISEEIVIN